MCKSFFDKLSHFLFADEPEPVKVEEQKVEPPVVAKPAVEAKPAEPIIKVKVVKKDKEVFIDPPKQPEIKIEKKEIPKVEPVVEKYEKQDIISPFFGSVDRPIQQLAPKKNPTMVRTKIISPIYGTQIIEEPAFELENTVQLNIDPILKDKEVFKKTKATTSKPRKTTAKKKTAVKKEEPKEIKEETKKEELKDGEL